ncbi:uncharacterized protein TNCV_2885851 [Trichonephila clavipes]|nr:uncharacterized protein TNCV_2885851 [Trichonephila clavipes]
MLGFPAMRKPTKKRSRRPSRLNPPEVPLTPRRAKSIISPYIDKCTVLTQKNKSLGKPWVTLINGGPIPRYLDRAEVVTRFCLTTGHDFWGIYLYWLGC